MLLPTLEVSVVFLLAGLGELIDQRAGTLNIGLEGMMVTGALASIIVTEFTGNPYIGVIGGMIGGGVLGLIHGILSISLRVDQVVSGTGIWLFGLGFTAYVGSPYTGMSSQTIEPILWGLNPLFFLSIALVPVTWFVLFKTSFGLTIRSVGEDPSVAEATGINVNQVRYICVIIGGLLSGVAGAYISLAYTPIWSRAVTAGRGWLALALVFFSLWDPVILLFGSLMFGFLWILGIQLHLIVAAPSALLRIIPYVMAIIILMIISSKKFGIRSREPAALGKSYTPEK